MVDWSLQAPVAATQSLLRSCAYPPPDQDVLATRQYMNLDGKFNLLRLDSAIAF